jgi:hypothetical protein
VQNTNFTQNCTGKLKTSNLYFILFFSNQEVVDTVRKFTPKKTKKKKELYKGCSLVGGNSLLQRGSS